MSGLELVEGELSSFLLNNIQIKKILHQKNSQLIAEQFYLGAQEKIEPMSGTSKTHLH